MADLLRLGAMVLAVNIATAEGVVPIAKLVLSVGFALGRSKRTKNARLDNNAIGKGA